MENNSRYTDYINQQNGGDTAYQARYGGNGYNPNQAGQTSQTGTYYQARYGTPYQAGYSQTAQTGYSQTAQTGYSQTTGTGIPTPPTQGPAPTSAGQTPAKKKKGTGKKVFWAAAITVLVLAAGVFGVWAVKSLSTNVNFSINGKTLIGDEANAGKNESDIPADEDFGNEKSDSTSGVTIKKAELAAATPMTVVTDVTEVVKNTMPCLVSVSNAYVSKMNYFGQTYSQKGESEGSGIIVAQNDTELLLVSNNHVVQDAEELTVTFVDESQAPAFVKGTDPNKDLAVIAVQLDDISPETMKAIALAELGDSEALTVGEPVVAIGNSLGYGQSVTTGVVSALHRPIGMADQQQGLGDVEVATFIQTDAAINPGNSGGALLNIYGQVIGINSNKIGGSIVEGMGYAIPISDAKPIIEDLMNQETKIKVPEEKRGYLGITGVNVEKQYAVMYGMPEGVYISSVKEGSGAEAAGLVKGDIIVGIEDTGVESMDELKAALSYYEAGSSVTLTIKKSVDGNYETQKVDVILNRG